MKKTSMFALIAVTTLAGYAVYRKKKSDARLFDNIGDIFPFIDTEGTTRHAVDALYWGVNGAMCSRKLAVLDKKLEALTKIDYSEYSHIEKQNVYKELAGIVKKLIDLGFDISVPAYERDELVKYKTPATWDVEDLLGIHSDDRRSLHNSTFYYSDVQRHRDLPTVVKAIVRVIDKNTKKGIFPDSRSFKAALFSEILRHNSSEHAIYTLCYILDNTDMLSCGGWFLMLKAYVLKHCIETGKNFATLNDDLFEDTDNLFEDTDNLFEDTDKPFGTPTEDYDDSEWKLPKSFGAPKLEDEWESPETFEEPVGGMPYSSEDIPEPSEEELLEARQAFGFASADIDFLDEIDNTDEVLTEESEGIPEPSEADDESMFEADEIDEESMFEDDEIDEGIFEDDEVDNTDEVPTEEPDESMFEADEIDDDEGESL